MIIVHRKKKKGRRDHCRFHFSRFFVERRDVILASRGYLSRGKRKRCKGQGNRKVAGRRRVTSLLPERLPDTSKLNSEICTTRFFKQTTRNKDNQCEWMYYTVESNTNAQLKNVHFEIKLYNCVIKLHGNKYQ